ncbi:MAG: hypothetical protein A2Y25_02500 [Candidatus Melainabacteria bacterium GWF2_37_15]|nr:MAG: hypothetical protein A2Y25_02500 [Candidatus Melainabacteria bacterium GWF2_37_15]
MGLPINFLNILNLYNIRDFSEFSGTDAYTIDDNVSIFFSSLENVAGNPVDGQISLAEYNKFLKLVNLPSYMSNGFFNTFDANDDGIITNEEFSNGLSSFDSNNNDTLDWNEGINIYNSFSNADIPSDITFTQYSNFLSTSQGAINFYDKNADGKIDSSEYTTILKNMGLDDSGATAGNLIDLYDRDNDNAINFEEFFLQNLQWDTNEDGVIEFDEGEAGELINNLPWYLRPSDSFTAIQKMVSSLIKSYDKDANKELSRDEFMNYMVKTAYFPKSMAEEIWSAHSSGDSLSFDSLVSLYEGFDSNNDDEMKYGELISFINSFSNIQIDSAAISETQYTGLYKLGAQAIKGYDGDGDGEISVDEYRAAIKQAETSYKNAGKELPEGFGQHMAENFVRLFDMDKTGTVSILEIINQYALSDSNKDGAVSSGEFLNMQERIEDKTLWNNVNEEFITNGDKDYDKALSLTELQNVLVTKGLPKYIAENAFTLFDSNQDAKLSRLELMEAFSRYDNSTVNTDYIEGETGEDYTLYTGNSNQVLDADEKLAMYEDLSGIAYTPDPAKRAQYEKILASSQELIKNYDMYKDGVLSADEYKKHFKAIGLPDYLADAIISAHDVSGDGSFDLLENLKLMLDYDLNQNGTLEFNEEFTLYDNLTGVGLNITEENKLQYSKLYTTVKNFLSASDISSNQVLNRDGSLQIDELAKYFISKGLPQDYADMALAAYDVNTDGGLDILEWMKAYAEFDVDGDGNIGESEELAFFDHIAGTDLSGITDSQMYAKIEDAASLLIQTYDKSDNNKKLSEAELIERMKSLGLPDYIAGEALEAFDLNADGGVDKLEWMKAYTGVDHNQNGVLEFNEELELYSNLSSSGLISASADDLKQYSTIYNSLKKFMTLRDDTTDRILNADELKDYFTQLELPEYMATEAVKLYDKNGDNGLDIYEWMLPNIEFDINKNGILEFNEVMGMNGVIADPDLPIDPNTMDVTQVTNLYNSVKKYITSLDTEYSDNRISESELIKKYKSLGLSDNIAKDVMASQDANSDGYLDLIEWLNTSLQFDANHTGILDFNELMNLYQTATGIELNATDANIKQQQTMYNSALTAMNTYDLNSDKRMSGTEFKKWLSASFGMTDSMASQVVSNYDSLIGNGDGEFDVLELTKALVDFDVNGNGVWDKDEKLNFVDNALPHIDLGGVNGTNVTQYSSLLSFTTSKTSAYGGGDNELTGAEFKKWLGSAYALTDDIANQVVSHYDTSGNGQMDTLELAQAMIALNTNNNGTWDNDERLNFIDNALPSIDLGGVDANNVTQYWSLFSFAFDRIKSNGGGDYKLTSAEFKTWLGGAYGLTNEMTDQVISYYDTNGDEMMDVMELTQAMISVNANSNGAWDNDERLNFFDNAMESINLGGVDSNNLKQYWSLFNFAIEKVKTYGNGDNKLTNVELKKWLGSVYALTDEMADQAISYYDTDGDSQVDALELTQALQNVDANANGIWDNDERLNFFDNALPSIDLGGVGSDNVTQYWKLYNYAITCIKTADLNFNRNLSQSEYRLYLEKQGIPNYIADAALSAYDTNKDGEMDALEFTKALTNFDHNQNGVWDFDEKMDFYEANSGVTLNADSTNNTQYTKLFAKASAFVNPLDLDKNKGYSADEYKVYLKKQGLPEYLADGMLSLYDFNKDGMIDIIEQTRAYIDLDINKSGAIEFDELMNYNKKLAGATGYNFSFTADLNNTYQLNKIYTSQLATLKTRDSNYDRTLQASEYERALIAAGFTAAEASTMAVNAVAQYDFNHDGGIDVFEWMDTVLRFDVNKNGVLDTAEKTSFYNSMK